VRSFSQRLVAEAQGELENPEEGERPLLEAATEQRLVDTTLYVITIYKV
jgi:hypothetical protein